MSVTKSLIYILLIEKRLTQVDFLDYVSKETKPSAFNTTTDSMCASRTAPKRVNSNLAAQRTILTHTVVQYQCREQSKNQYILNELSPVLTGNLYDNRTGTGSDNERGPGIRLLSTSPSSRLELLRARKMPETVRTADF
ncbi:Hypothetical predicted protein [Pelobates cultripes]|uniref:Uncharacterized protein n=1 Tax=Pelobates cultripes TaxID=61616 RepID=A0AAD1QWC2_PELCU|nr:Hypothetical predicted protein [Pelobates cultripes]